MSENLAAKHYKGNKRRLQKKFIKDTKTFPKKKEKKKKSDNMIRKISQKIKTKVLKKIL